MSIERFADFEDLNLPRILVSVLWLVEELQLELAKVCPESKKARIAHREAAHQIRADREALMLYFGIPEEESP